MKKLLLVVPAIFLFFSCEQDDVFPRVENITRGEKWTLQIGSSPMEVYHQIQQLGSEKNFNNVAIIYRKPYSKPNEIKSNITLYKAITLETTSGITERVLIQFDQDKVSSIEKGGALLDAITKWPENESGETSININDPIDEVYEKLLAIYQIPKYADYQIVLPDKWLEKPYDPDMANYEEWAFDFSEDIGTGKVGRSFVRLFFNNKKLVKIRHEYHENEVVS